MTAYVPVNRYIVTVHVRNWQYLLTEIDKPVHNIGPVYRSDMFKQAYIAYNMRNK